MDLNDLQPRARAAGWRPWVWSGTVAVLLWTPAGLRAQAHGVGLLDLPNAPSAVLGLATESVGPQQGGSQSLPPDIAAPGAQAPPLQPMSDQAASASLPPCPRHAVKPVPVIFLPQTGSSCQHEDQVQSIVEAGTFQPLTPADKGVLAIRAVTDPFNLLTIVVFSGISVAANAHSDYGPGFKGWGRLMGYSLAEDIQSEFTGTYALPVIFHEDPRYHRMAGAPVGRRLVHALIHTVVSQHDNGSLMPNYATLINYPLSAEISDLYVPGLPTNVKSTAERVAVGYATDPVGPIVAEFLPDFAKRVHIHIVFAQQILNRIAQGNTTGGNSPL